MPRTPDATFLQNLVVRPGDAITGQDSTVGPGDFILVRAGSSSFAGAAGGDGEFRGGSPGAGGSAGRAGIGPGGTLPVFATSPAAVFAWMRGSNEVGGFSAGAAFRTFAGGLTAGGAILGEAGSAITGSGIAGGFVRFVGGAGVPGGAGGPVELLGGLRGAGSTDGGVVVKGGGAVVASLPGGIQLDASPQPSVEGASLHLTAATVAKGGMATCRGGHALGLGIAGGDLALLGGVGDAAGAGGVITIAGGVSPGGLGGSVSIAAGPGVTPGVVNLDGPLGRDAAGYKFGIIPGVTTLSGTAGLITFATPFGPGAPIVMTASWVHPAGPPIGLPTALVIHSVTSGGFAIDWTPFTATSGPWELHWVARQ